LKLSLILIVSDEVALDRALIIFLFRALHELAAFGCELIKHRRQRGNDGLPFFRHMSTTQACRPIKSFTVQLTKAPRAVDDRVHFRIGESVVDRVLSNRLRSIDQALRFVRRGYYPFFDNFAIENSPGPSAMPSSWSRRK